MREREHAHKCNCRRYLGGDPAGAERALWCGAASQRPSSCRLQAPEVKGAGGFPHTLARGGGQAYQVSRASQIRRTLYLP